MESVMEASLVVAVVVLSIIMVGFIILLSTRSKFSGQSYNYMLLNIAPGISEEALRGHLKSTLPSKFKDQNFLFGKTTALFSCSDRLDPDDWENCEKYQGRLLVLLHMKSDRKVQCSEKLGDAIQGCKPSHTNVKQKTYRDANRKPFHTVQLEGSGAEIFVFLDRLPTSNQFSSGKENSPAEFYIDDESTKPLISKGSRTDKHAKLQKRPLDVVQPAGVGPHWDGNKEELLDIEEDLYCYAMMHHKGKMENILNPKPFSSEFRAGALKLEGPASLVSKAAEDIAVFCQSLTTGLSRFVYKLSEGIDAEAFRREAEKRIAAPNKTLLFPVSDNTLSLYGPKDREGQVREGLKNLESQLRSPVVRIQVQPKSGSVTSHFQAEPVEPRSMFSRGSAYSAPYEGKMVPRQSAVFEKVEVNHGPTKPGHLEQLNGETSHFSQGPVEKAKLKKIVVSVLKGDLTKQSTNVIVNPANRKLLHGGGAAKAIAEAAGPKLLKECQDYIKRYGELKTGQVMYTTSGNLPPQIKYVIHAVGPSVDKYQVQKDLVRKLEETFFNCLNCANNQLQAKSISIPAISAGIYGVSKELVAHAAQTALNKFEHEGTGRALTLEKVNFVNIDDESTEAFLEVFGGRRPRTASDDPDLVKTAQSKSADQPKRKRALLNKASSSTFVPEGAASGLSNGATVNPATTAVANGDDSDDCVICMETMISPKALPCGHKFCEDCIKDSFEKCQPKCPSCGRLFGVMRGNQPPGKMHISTIPQSLTGYEVFKTILVQYDIPNGIQNGSHPNPGVQYWGTNRVAYLPDNKEGREVCDLLRKAFDAGLIFTVGRSTTTGRDNQVIWNDIHHKTSEVGPYGYPDASYLSRVKEELKAKGIVSDTDDHKPKQTVI